MVRREAGVVLLEGFVSDMEALVAVLPPTSRRDASMPWLCRSRAAMTALVLGQLQGAMVCPWLVFFVSPRSSVHVS